MPTLILRGCEDGTTSSISPPARSYRSNSCSSSRAPVALPDLRAKGGLLNNPNLIWVVQSHLQKYTASRFAQITSRTHPVSSHRGAARDRHGRGAGCGGRRRRQRRERGLADGGVVSSRRPR